MSVIKNGINNGFSGKTGAVVGYLLNGQWVMRGLPRLSRKNKKGSTTQNVYRSKFKMAQKFLKPLIYIIRMSYKELADQTVATGHNLAMSHLLKDTFNEQGEIDYTKVLISKGSLPPLSPVSLSSDGEDIELTWDPKHPLNLNSGYDHLLIVVYDPDEADVLFQGTDVPRKTGKTKISLKSQFKRNKDYHVWVGCINDSRTRVSDSQYVGVVTV